MASNFNFLKTSFINIIIFMSLFTSSFSSDHITLQTPTISAAPALLPNPPLSSPYTELSPDISPLLPSPSGNALSPGDSSLPTIPSTRTPDPDLTGSVGPDAAVAPTGLIQESSAMDKDSIKVISGLLVSLLVMSFMII